nr:50S ribosomal protein L5 [uncultured archaeon]
MKTQKNARVNVMRKPFISKVVLSAGATGPELDKAKRLLEILTNAQAHIIKAGSKRRIPELNVRPGLELGTRVTLRGEKAILLLRRLLTAIELDGAVYRYTTNALEQSPAGSSSAPQMRPELMSGARLVAVARAESRA